MKPLAYGVIGVAGVLTLAALGCSYYMGTQIEQAFERSTQDWSSQDGFSVSILEYDRGIAHSRAKTQWSFHDEDEGFEVTATHDITHGPWANGQGGSIDSQFQLPENSDSDLRAALAGQPIFRVFTTVGWKGHSTHDTTNATTAASTIRQIFFTLPSHLQS